MMRTPPALLSVLFVCACAADIQTAPPSIATPAAWTVASTTVRETRDESFTPWWRQFADRSLDEIVEAALRNNGDIEVARARVMEARALRQGAAATLLPRVDGGVEIGRQSENENTRPVNAAQAQIEARWDADLFGVSRRALDAQRALEGAAEAEADAVAQALALESARAYVDVREAQQRFRIAERNLSTQRETLALTRVRQSAGLASFLDVSQAESLTLATESALPALQGQAKAAIRRLEGLTAVLPATLDASLGTETALPRASLPTVIETPADIVAMRPDLRIAERRLAASNAALAAAEATRYPALNLRALFGVRELSPETMALPSQALWTLAGGLTAPLFDAGRIEAQVRAADARVQQAAADYRQRAVEAFSEVEAALALLIAAENERVAFTRAAASAMETERLADERYRRGLASFIEVLDAQRGVYQAEDRVAASEATAARRVIALHAALGSPTAPVRTSREVTAGSEPH